MLQILHIIVNEILADPSRSPVELFRHLCMTLTDLPPHISYSIAVDAGIAFASAAPAAAAVAVVAASAAVSTAAALHGHNCPNF